MEDVMENTWGKTGSTSASMYISLANEQGMGVNEFIKKIPKNMMEKNIHFQEFPNEIHNSVGLPTYKWALGDIFKKWYVKEEYFGSAEALKNHYSEVKKQYGSIFKIPYTIVGNTHYMLQKNEKERAKVQAVLKELNPNALVLFNTYRAGKLVDSKDYAEAEQLLKDALAINPNNFDSYDVLARIKMANGNTTEANETIDKALGLANKQQARQWQINELLETKAEINKKP